MRSRSKSSKCVAAGVLLLALVFADLAVTNCQQAPVTLTLTITDKTGRYVGGLRMDQVSVFEAGLPQEIVSFQKDDIPVSVGFVFENSFLKLADVFKASHTALLKFIADGHPRNEYFVMGFDERVPSAAEFSKDRDQLARELANLRAASPSRKTALYDAIGKSLELIDRGVNAKRAIVLIADDRENSSQLRREEVVELLKRRDVLLYEIRLKAGGTNTVSPVFDEFSLVTGGKTFYPKGLAEFTDFFEIIALELRHQYSLQYKSQDSRPGAWRDLKFVVQPLRLRNSEQIEMIARGRSGYYK